jgi:TonB family protein
LVERIHRENIKGLALGLKKPSAPKGRTTITSINYGRMRGVLGSIKRQNKGLSLLQKNGLRYVAMYDKDQRFIQAGIFQTELKSDLKTKKEELSQAKKPPSPKATGIIKLSKSHIPKRIHYEKPVYPKVALAARITGIVRVEVTLNKSGKVIKSRILSGGPMLQQAALDAVNKWIYEPYMAEGKPTPCRFEVLVRFNF